MTYSNRLKIDLLGVNSVTLDEFGAVSPAIAQEMAFGVKQRLKTDWGVSITGIAGPGGGSEEKPVGLVYIGIADPQGEVESFECRFGVERGRDLTRYLSACSALDQLRRKLLKS
jgi:nicotinamide-nucleotide amidase